MKICNFCSFEIAFPSLGNQDRKITPTHIKDQMFSKKVQSISIITREEADLTGLLQDL